MVDEVDVRVDGWPGPRTEIRGDFPASKSSEQERTNERTITLLVANKT